MTASSPQARTCAIGITISHFGTGYSIPNTSKVNDVKCASKWKLSVAIHDAVKRLNESKYETKPSFLQSAKLDISGFVQRLTEIITAISLQTNDENENSWTCSFGLANTLQPFEELIKNCAGKSSPLFTF